jgi:hypothetical protein
VFASRSQKEALTCSEQKYEIDKKKKQWKGENCDRNSDANVNVNKLNLKRSTYQKDNNFHNSGHYPAFFLLFNTRRFGDCILWKVERGLALSIGPISVVST